MNILAVDDERIALSALVDGIQGAVKERVNLYAFRTGKEALECAMDNHIDIAFLDVEMRDMTGIELAQSLKTIFNRTNIIFVTGYTTYAMEAMNLYASGYLLKPVNSEKVLESIHNLRYPIDELTREKLKVQCFGNFEVFIQGEPLKFSRQKSKELFAYLIDRRGAQVTMAEIASVLWEDGKYNTSRNNQIHSFLHDLIKTLEIVGKNDIIIRKRNALAVDVSQIECDSYDCMNGDINAINSYAGEYMSQYFWAEFTTGKLTEMLW